MLLSVRWLQTDPDADKIKTLEAIPDSLAVGVRDRLKKLVLVEGLASPHRRESCSPSGAPSHRTPPPSVRRVSDLLSASLTIRS